MKIKNYTTATVLTLALFITINSVAQNFLTPPISNPFGLITDPSEGVYQPTFIDIDNDGDQDLFIGRSNSSARKLEFYENTGTATSPDFSSPAIINPFNIVVNSPTPYNNFVLLPSFGDVDGDGDFDLIIGMGDNTGDFEYYQNNGTASVADFATATVHNIPDAVAPLIFDIDSDGDQDFFFGNNPDYTNPNVNVQFHENDGTGTFNSIPLSPAVTGNGAAYPALGDLDLDGHIDIIVGENTNDILFYKGDGTGNYNLTGTLLTGVDSQQSPALVDIDADGDLDLFIGMEAQLVMYENHNPDDPTAIADIQNEIFNMYPNPATDIIHFQATESILQIELFDSLGKSVLVYKGELSQIDIQELPIGIYTVKVRFSNEQMAVKRIIKQ